MFPSFFVLFVCFSLASVESTKCSIVRGYNSYVENAILLSAIVRWHVNTEVCIVLILTDRFWLGHVLTVLCSKLHEIQVFMCDLVTCFWTGVEDWWLCGPSWGLPQAYLRLTSGVPQAYLTLTSGLPQVYLRLTSGLPQDDQTVQSNVWVTERTQDTTWIGQLSLPLKPRCLSLRFQQ